MSDKIEWQEEWQKEYSNAMEAIIRKQCEEISCLHEEVARLNKVISLCLCDDEDGNSRLKEGLALWATSQTDPEKN